MPEKQKPIPRIVKVAAKAMKDPESVTNAQIKSMAARILDDQKNDPQPHKPAPKRSQSMTDKLNAATRADRKRKK